MPVIKVWCLPKLSERKLNGVFKGIVSAVESVPELGLKGEKSMTVLFPTDAMKYGLGTEIIVEVTGLFVKPERTDEVRQRLAEEIGTTVKGLFPKAMVECFVFPFDPTQGFWTNPRMGPRREPKEVAFSDLGYCSERRRRHD
jgi:hypothetical protein